jgi:hypothetical protein
VISALLYLQFTSTWNRLVARLKRLRQPKYLVGGVVGGLYVYFYFFRYLFLGPSGREPEFARWFNPENRMLIECGAALLVGLIVVLSWVLPNKRAALNFSESEIAFLFPAPVTRRTLIQFKLIRAQLGILFTVLIFSLVSRRFGGNTLVHALGWWLVLSTLSLHFLGVSFVRTLLLDRGITHWKRRTAILTLVGLVAAIAGVWLWRSLAQIEPARTPAELLDQVRQFVTTGPIPVVLFPFRLLVRPYLASTLLEFLIAAWPALAILFGHYWFVLRADVAFEEASVEASRKMEKRLTAVRAGPPHGRGNVKPRRPPFTLSATGAPAVALFWKNLISMGQFMNKRFLLILVLVAVVASLGVAGSNARGGVAGVLGMLSLMFLAWSILLGPQILAQDFRQDLKMADLIKRYPISGRQVVLGELMAPALLLTFIQWLLIPFAVGGLVTLDREAELSMGMIGGFAFSLAIMAPAINFLSFVIPNASVLLFPAWFQTDRSTPHGIEAMGQRIVTLFGQLLLLFLSALPAGVVYVAVLLLVKWVAGWLIAAPLAGVCASLVIGLEVAFAVVLMGRWFEKLDVSGEGRT